MKRLKIVVLSIIACICCLFGVACTSTPIEVALLEPAFRPDVYVNQEFDVMSALDEPNEKYTYEITECYYLDNTLKRFDIPFNGTKFTQNWGYDVFITLKVSDGRNSTILEFELSTYIQQTPLQTAYISSYSAGTQKMMSVDPNYLTEGESTAVKVTVNAVTNNQAEGTQTGSFDFKTRSNTSWDNVVITMNIYNTYSRDMMIGLNICDSLGTIKTRSMFDAPQLIPSGEWTKVNWSLRALGFDYDLVQEKITFGIKTLLPNTDGFVAPWRYTFYICGMDICDYSQEKFPDLDTRTLEEKVSENDVDASDVYLQTHNRELGTVISNYANTYTTATVQKYSDAELVKPTDMENSKSFVKYEIKATRPNAEKYVSTALNFKNGWAGNPVAEEEKELFTATNWENAFVGMWVYNDSDLPMEVRAKGIDGKATLLAQKQWTYVEYSLAKIYDITNNIFEEESYNFRLFFGCSSKDMNDLETYQNFTPILYVDGFDFFNKAPSSYNTVTDAFIGSAVKSHETSYVYFYTNVVATEDSSVKYGEQNTIKYTVSDDGRSSTAGRRWFAPMAFEELNPFSALLTNLDMTAEDINENSRVRFFVKNTSPHKLRFVWLSGEKINLNDVDSAVANGTAYAEVLGNSDWTKVDLPLINVYEALLNANERVSLCAGFLSTGNPFESQTYYMGGFEIYEPTGNDFLVNSAVNSYSDSEKSYNYFYTNVAVAEDGAVKYDEENSIKYTVSDDGRSTTAGRRWFVPMEFDADNKFADFLSALNINPSTVTKNSRIRFYVKNTSTNYELAFVLMDASKDWFGLNNISTANGSYETGVMPINVPKNSDWTKVEFSLADVYEKLIAGEGRISLMAGYLNTTNPFATQTYYMGGFEIYTPTKEDVLPAYAQCLNTWYEAGTPTAQKAVYQGQTVVKYDVTVNQQISEITPNAGKANVFANMFVGKNGLPADLLNVCGVSTTAWQNGVKISFEVYSDVAIEFRKHYTTDTATPGMSSTTGEVVKTTTAGEWTKVEIEFSEITSATFTGWARIMTKVACSSYEQDSVAYSYYVRDFNVTVL